MKKKYLYAFLLLMGAAAVFFLLGKKKKSTDLPAVVRQVAVAKSGYHTLSTAAVFFTDLEDPDPSLWTGEKNPGKYFSGKFSNKLSEQREYGITFSKKGMEIPQHEKIREVRISFQLFSGKKINKASLVYAVSGSKDKMYEYFQEKIHGDKGVWTGKEIIMHVNAAAWGDDATVKIFPWNEGKEIFFVDDIKIEFLAEVENRPGIALGPQQNFIFDFEQVNDSMDLGDVSKDVAHSGQYSIVLSGSDTYTKNIVKRFSEISTDTIKFISTSVWIYPKEEHAVVTLVVSMEKPDGTSISWQGKATDRMDLEKNKWHKINFRADLRGIKTNAEDVVKIYLWNKKGGTVYADDLEIVYGDVPKPAGAAAGMMMSIYGDPVSVPGKNKPPFRQTWFSPAPFPMPASEFLVDDGNIKEGEMNPQDLVLSGNFLQHRSPQDDLFIADKTNWSLYTWCSAEKKFAQATSSAAPNGANRKVVLTGNFEKGNQAEILLIDTAGNFTMQAFHFTSAAANTCEMNSAKMQQANVSAGMDASYLKGRKWYFESGNFTGDTRDELLLLSADGLWNILEKKNGGFTTLSSGTIARGNILSVHPIPTGNKTGRLLVFNERDKKLDYCMLDFSGGKNNCSVHEYKDKSFLDYYSKLSSFLSGNFEKASPDLFYLDKDWRFDLKKIELADNGIFINSQIDFDQPDAGRNPKFYEYTKLVKGKFFDTGADYLLVMMRNCKDADFNGFNCNEFEEVEGMPSGYLFYQYKPAE